MSIRNLLIMILLVSTTKMVGSEENNTSGENIGMKRIKNNGVKSSPTTTTTNDPLAKIDISKKFAINFNRILTDQILI